MAHDDHGSRTVGQRGDGTITAGKPGWCRVLGSRSAFPGREFQSHLTVQLRRLYEHLAMRLTSNRAHALRPVRSAQGIEQFRAGLNEPAPEALSSRVAGGGKGVHSDPPPASHRHHLQHRAPYHIVDGHV